MEGYENLFGPRRFYRRLLGLGIFSAVVLLAPLVVEDPYYLEVLFLCHYYVILACSWDLLSGYTGNINFGHAFFIAGAGYTGALLNLNVGWPYWLTLPVGGIIAALFGLLVGVVTLRLKGPYLLP
jgi:branched-chain amino acid transport system permease protein